MQPAAAAADSTSLLLPILNALPAAQAISSPLLPSSEVECLQANLSCGAVYSMVWLTQHDACWHSSSPALLAASLLLDAQM
jgi:hypothetical protein